MKRKIISVFLVSLLSISITACSNNKSSASPVSSSKNINNSVMEAYKSVLQNKAEFYSTDNKRNVYLKDFLTNKEIYGTTFKLTQFTVLDMDYDKVPEVILELSVDNSPFGFEILHYMNGTVYGYNIVYRGLESLKIDGTFWASSGAFDNECGKLKFNSNAYETDILGYMKSSQNSNGTIISYFINNKPVTKELFEAFTKEQNAKKDVNWYEFSQENIETKLSIGS